jgi:photosystem II stability/assembly factor-like uncharacterized protein
MKLKLFFLLLLISTVVSAQFWTEKVSGFADASRGINQFVITSGNEIWATAYDGSGGGANVQEFTKSSDLGETWTTGTIDLGPATAGVGIGCIAAVDGNTAWVTGYPNTTFDQKGIWKTVDGGLNWTKQNSASFNNSASFPNIVYFWDSNVGFCQGDPVGGYFEIYTTTDGGDNWVRTPSSSIPDELTGEYGYVRQIEVVGDRLWFTTNKGRIYRSDDKGITFSVYQSPITDFGSASSSGNISFWDENNGLLASAQGGLWITSDGGENWTSITSPDDSIFDVECVAGSSNALITSVNTAGDTYSSFYSTDNGVTWNLVDNTQRIELEFKGGLGFASGFSVNSSEGGLFKYTGSELVLSIGNNFITKANLYPNPVVDNLTIKSDKDISNVIIFNLLGVKVLDLNPHDNNVVLNLNKLDSGSYIVRINVGETTETVKILKK